MPFAGKKLLRFFDTPGRQTRNVAKSGLSASRPGLPRVQTFTMKSGSEEIL
jgi:hypothetical protein